MRSLAPLVAGLVLATALTPGVAADVVSVADAAGDNAGHAPEDPNVPVAGALDLASVTHEHADAGYERDDLLVHVVEMHSDWPNAWLDPSDSHGARLSLRFRHDAGQAFVDVVERRDGSLTGLVSVTSHTAEEIHAGFANVWRRDGRTVVVELTKSQIRRVDPERLTEYSWYAVTWDGRCQAGHDEQSTDPCFDYAPDDQTLRHVLVGPGSLDCTDGVDNDGDGLADFGHDTGCTSAEDPFEGVSDADGDCNRRSCAVPSFHLRLAPALPRRNYPLLRGHIRSPLRQCLGYRYVSLFRVARGPDERVHRTGSHPKGHWLSYLPERPGRYYVVIEPHETEAYQRAPGDLVEAVRCSLIESNVLRLRK